MPLAAPVTTATLPRYPGTFVLSLRAGLAPRGDPTPGARVPAWLARRGRPADDEVLVQAGVVTPRGLRAADLFLRGERQAGLGERGQVRVGDGGDRHRQDVDLRALVVQHPEGHVEVR